MSERCCSSTTSDFRQFRGVYYAFAFSCVVLAPRPTSNLSNTVFLAGPLSGAPSLRDAPGSQRTRVGYQRCLSEMGLVPIRAPMGLRVWSCGTEALRTLDKLEIEFPGKNIYSWNSFERPTNYDFFTQQRRSIIHQPHLAALNDSHTVPVQDHAPYTICHDNPLQPSNNAGIWGQQHSRTRTTCVRYLEHNHHQILHILATLASYKLETQFSPVLWSVLRLDV